MGNLGNLEIDVEIDGKTAVMLAAALSAPVIVYFIFYVLTK